MASSDPFQHLRIEGDGPLRRLILDRPPLNILTIDMLREMEEALGLIAEDPEASVLVVSGEGRAFCAGVDVADHTADKVHDMIRVFHGALTRMATLEMPVVAAVNGAALGGGLEVALAADIVVARAGAKLGQPEIVLGVFPPFAAAVLPRLVGRAQALDLCLTGRTITAEEGREMGLVQHVYPKEDFASAADEYLGTLTGLSRPVLRLTKRAIVDGLDAPAGEALHVAERIYLDELMELDDAHEGLAAFMEKRDPAWKGA
jgi:cyclohexa-1,5-dienecarbonyl-CoA hydratase